MTTFVIHPLPAGDVDTAAPLPVHFAGPGCFAFRVDPA